MSYAKYSCEYPRFLKFSKRTPQIESHLQYILKRNLFYTDLTLFA